MYFTIRQNPSFSCHLCYDSHSFGSEKVFDKTIAAKVYGSNFVIFHFLENEDFFWNSVESSEFVSSVT